MPRFNRKKWSLAILAAILLLTGCANSQPVLKEKIDSFSTDTKEQVIAQKDRYSATFIRYVDGDTSVLAINGKEQKVRFLLIDTPETVKANTPVQSFGPEASARTKELLTQAQVIEFRYDQGDKVDRYGRTLDYIFVDG